MKKTLLAFFQSILLVSLVFASSGAFAQTTLHDEGVSGDLPNTGSGTTLSISGAGTYIIKGQVSTPSDGQDRFTLSIGAGLQITSGTYTLTGGGSPINFFTMFNLVTYSGPGSGSLVGLPLGAGSYFGMISADFSVGNSWQISVTVGVACTPPATTTSPVSTTVCAGANAIFTAAASGTPSPTVQWQRSTDGGATYSNISGATSTTLSFATVAGDDNNRYRAVFTNTCGTATTTSAPVHVNVAPSVTTNPSNNTTCAGSAASFTVAASGTPTPTVQWQKSTDGGATFNNIVGATSTFLSFTSASSDNGNQYRAVFTNTCSSATTTAATLAVTTGVPVVTGNPTDEVICSNIGPAHLNSSGTNYSSVQWQKSTDGGTTWSSVSAFATTPSLTLVTTFVDGEKLRAAYSNVCGTTYTTTQTLTIGTAPSVTTNPSNTATCNGATVTFTAAASGTPTPTVQWQKSTDAGATYNNIVGATSTVLSFSTVLGDDGNMYRAVFTNSCGSATTTGAKLNINTPISITTNPVSGSVCVGNNAVFTAAASTTSTVQWQKSTDGGVTYNNIVGATSATLSFTTVLGDNANQYRAVFTNACGGVFTTAAVLTISNIPAISTNPNNLLTCAGSTASFSAASSTPSTSVNWQVSTDGVTYNDIPGATSTTLSFTATAGVDGYLYRGRFYNTCGTAYSSSAMLNVSSGFSIAFNPTDQSVCAGSSVTFFAVTSVSTPAPTVQWQVSSDNGATYNNIAGATDNSLNFTTTAADNGKIYRAAYTQVCGTQYTTAALLTVSTMFSVTTNPVAQTVCAGNTATYTAGTAGTPTPAVQWQVSTNGGATYNDISGATTTTLNVATTAADNGKYYRAKFTNLCGTAFSTGAILNVISPLSVTTNPVSQTICSGASVFFTAATAPVAFSVQWQVSTDAGATYNDIPGANSNTYTFITASTDNGKMYRARFSNTCGSVFTSAAVLTMHSPITVTVNPADQTMCESVVAFFNSAATVAAGTPTPTVQWQLSTDGGASWNNMAGSTNTSITFTATAAQNASRYRAVYTNVCGSVNTTSAQLNVNTGPVVTTNPVIQTVCAGAVASFTAVATSSPAPTVQWQVSTDGGVSFNSIPGATSTTLSFTTTAADNAKRYRALFVNLCGSAYSTNALLNVTTGLTITTNPTSQNVCVGTAVTFSSVATGTPAPSSIQWQVSTDGGVTFNNIPGANLSDLSFVTTLADNDKRYRAVYTQTCGTYNTTAATLNIGVPIVITTNPAAVQTICAGTPVTFSSAVTGTPTPTVQWQVSLDGFAWNNIPGAVFPNLTFTALASQNGNRYRAVYNNFCSGNVITSVGALYVPFAAAVTTQPTNKTTCAGLVTSFTADASGSPTPAIQWQVSTDGGGSWNNVPGATSTIYSLTTAAVDNNKQFRAVFTNSCGTATSNPALLTVNIPVVITTNPTSQAVCNGSTVSLVSAATGTPTPTLLWQYSLNGGISWIDIPGVNTPTYTFVASPAVNNYRYRVLYSNFCGSVATSGATLTINLLSTVTTQPTNQTVCLGNAVSFTSVAAGSPAPTQQWQVSADGGGTWNNVPGATNNTYSFTPVVGDNNKQYRSVFTNVCNTTISNAVTLTVNVPITITTNPTTQSVCNGSSITLVSAATGTPTPTVQWQYSTNGGTSWVDLLGYNSPTYTFTASPMGVNYRYRAVYSNYCGTVATSGAVVTVNLLPNINTQPVDTRICETSSISFPMAASGTGITYQWQVNTGSGFVNIPAGAPYSGITSNTLYLSTTSVGMTGYTYRCLVSGVCAPAKFTNVVTLTVDTLPKVLIQPTDTTVCELQNAVFSIKATATDIQYQWQIRTPSGSYADLVDDPIYNGVYTNTLTVRTPQVAMTGSRYRCIVRGRCAPQDISTDVAIHINTAPKIINQSSTNVTICNTANDSFKVIATGTALTYQWQISTNGGGSWNNVSNGGAYNGATTNTLTLTGAIMTMNNNQYRCIVSGTCAPPAISDPVMLSVINTTTWMGGVDEKWSNPANWSCGIVPLATTTVYIPEGVPHWPLIDIPNAICDSIIFEGNANLAFMGTNNRLDVKGSLICTSCSFDASLGTVIYSGTKKQLAPRSTYKILEMNGTGDKILTGEAIVLNNMIFASGNLILNNYNVMIGDDAVISGGSATSHFVTNSTGTVKVQNVGIGGKLSSQTVPLSDGSTYTPLTFSNSGSNNTFTAAVYDNTNTSYDMYLRPVGTNFTEFAVGKSWRLSDDTGGSNVTLQVQWNDVDELPNFNRNACYMSDYATPDWNPAPAITSVSEVNTPYTLTMSGITNMKVFSVQSGGPTTTFRPRAGTVIAFPNPASSTLKLKFNVTPGRNVNIYIINTFGVEVYRVTENPYNYTDGIIPIDVSALYPGEYLINVEDVDDGHEIRSTRFIKP